MEPNSAGVWGLVGFEEFGHDLAFGGFYGQSENVGCGGGDIDLSSLGADDRAFLDSRPGRVEQNMTTASAIAAVIDEAVFHVIEMATVVVRHKEDGVVFHARSGLDGVVDGSEIGVRIANLPLVPARLSKNSGA